MKTIEVRNGNEIVVSGDILKPFIKNGDNLSLSVGSKTALIKAIVNTMDSQEHIDSLAKFLNSKRS